MEIKKKKKRTEKQTLLRNDVVPYFGVKSLVTSPAVCRLVSRGLMTISTNCVFSVARLYVN